MGTQSWDLELGNTYHSVTKSLQNAALGANAQKNRAMVSSYAGGFLLCRSRVYFACDG
jgi:hypothetical protein